MLWSCRKSTVPCALRFLRDGNPAHLGGGAGRDRGSRPSRPGLAVVCCLLILLGGCGGNETGEDGFQDGLPLDGVKLRLLVVSDPEMAAAIGMLQGEWKDQTGSDVLVESMAEEELVAGETITADAVICSSSQLGPLAERKLILPVPKKMLEANAGDWSEVFELLRLRETAWGREVYGVVFGSPVLTCYYRADLLEKLGRRPPQSWAEYQQLAQLLADRKGLGDSAPADVAAWSGTVEPLGTGWAGLVLLARAAPYAKHRANYSTLFNFQTMEPLVAGPPFVRALEELVATAGSGSADQLRYDPAAARTAFWQGRCGMALSWPTRAEGVAPTDVSTKVRAGFAELPGSAEAYDVGAQQWDPRTEEDDLQVPLLATAGRIGVVTTESANPAGAFQLLFWLSGAQFSPQVCTASPATTFFRRSQLNSPRQWGEGPILPAAAAQYATLTAGTFCRRQWLFALRIPGRSEYLAALDEAVHGAVRGRQTPAEALQQAAARWQQITERLGLQQQQAAYLHSLGLE